MNGMNRNDLLVLACMSAAGVVVGSLGPWESGPGLTEAGTNGAGLYTLWLGGLSAVLLLASWLGRRRDTGIAGAFLGALILGIALYRLLDVSSRSGPLGTDPVDPGWGVWLTVVGGAGLAITSLALIWAPGRRISDEP
jgi:hypothetical protein